MKYLNTKYPSLFDSIIGTASINYNAIYLATNTSQRYCIKNTSATSIYVKFRLAQNYTGSTLTSFVSIVMNNGTTIRLRGNSTDIQIDNTTTSSVLWQGGIPSVNDWPISGYYYRDWYIHIDTILDVIDVYSDGTKYASVSAGLSGEVISSIEIGKFATGSSYAYSLYLQNIIISDTAFSVNETITEVAPTITSTDWTVSSGVATADTVGASMTLTAPSGSIDETKRTVTGYGLAFFNSTPSETINALNITQGATTKQVIIPSGSVETADTFAVSQLSDISATAVAAYVSQ